MDIIPDLEDDMNNNTELIEYFKDDDVATEFYSALCNVRWIKINHLPEDEQIIQKLKGEEDHTWSCSWRSAGGIIADIRNAHYNTCENYMDFYCRGNEGHISDRVKECFLKMGWKPFYLDIS